METVKPKRSLVDETYEILIDAICSGEIASGTRLNQDDIAARLNVSRQPVNSAISILKANGLVEDNGRRSVVVTRFDPKLFRSIYDYRKIVEPFSVRLAGNSFSDKEKLQANKVLKNGQKAARNGKLNGLVEADMQFHEMIYAWSGNQVIETSMKTNWHHIRRSMSEVLRDPEAVMPVWDEHAEIVEHMFDGHIEKAADAMKYHIEYAYRTIVDAMEMEKKQFAPV
ncbi:MAG: GntR family transcriptional regulator [Salaquimonas sp.]